MSFENGNIEYRYKTDQDPEDVKCKLEEEKLRIDDAYKKNEFENLERISGRLEELSEIAIEKINSFLKINEIDVEEVKKEDLNIFTTTSETDTHYSYYDNRIILPIQNINGKTEGDIIKSMVHEIFHHMSHSRITLLLNDEKTAEYVMRGKTGYSSYIRKILTDSGNTLKRDIFQAFDEGVTEALTYSAFGYEISKVSYKDEVDLVFKIVKKIYSGEVGLKKFIQGYLDGSMMHLRDIEKFYGKKSLSLLASIETKENLEKYYSDTEELEQEKKYREMALSFFMEDDEEKRKKILEDIDDFLSKLKN